MMGKILYNMICNQNADRHTKKHLKSKNVFEIKIQSERISQIQNPSV